MFTTNCRSRAPSTREPQTKCGKCGCHLGKRRIGEALTNTKAASPFWKTVTIWVIMNMFYEINRCTVKSSLMFSAETSLSYSDNVHVLTIHLTIQTRGMQLKYRTNCKICTVHYCSQPLKVLNLAAWISKQRCFTLNNWLLHYTLKYLFVDCLLGKASL